MRKDVLWEPFFILAFHLKMTDYKTFYNMPVRMRNWLIERTVEEYRKQNEANGGNDNKLVDNGEEVSPSGFKTFRPF